MPKYKVTWYEEKEKEVEAKSESHAIMKVLKGEKINAKLSDGNINVKEIKENKGFFCEKEE